MSKHNEKLKDKLTTILEAFPGDYRVVFNLDQNGNVTFGNDGGLSEVYTRIVREGTWLMATPISVGAVELQYVSAPVQITADIVNRKVTSLEIVPVAPDQPARDPNASFSCVISELAKVLAKVDSTNRLSPFSFLVGGYGAQMIFNRASQEDMNAIRGISDVLYSNLRLKDGDHVHVTVTDNSTFAEHDFDIRMRWIDLPQLP